MSTENSTRPPSATPEDAMVCPRCAEWISLSGTPQEVDCLSCGSTFRLNVAARKARDQIRMVDSRWAERRKPYLVQSRSGEWIEPDIVPWGLLFLLVPGVMFVVIGAATGQPSMMMVGAAIMVLGIGFSARKWKKLEHFRRERRRFEAERREWLLELGRAQRDFRPK